jgi:poly-gamma-glutamate capsule biosynthesis protein CapA/YwtB (metallophosphatase superfamily)
MEEQEYERDEKALEARRLKRLEQKRRRRMQQRIVGGVLLVIAVLVIVLIARSCGKKQAAPAASSSAASSQAAASAPAVQATPDTVATLAAVGDIMVYDNQIAAAKQTDGSYNFDDSFKAVSALTQGADYTVGNLELNFCGTPYSGMPNFRAPESLAASLKTAGFDMVQTANTYSIQNGISGLQSTLKYLDAAGLAHVGTYASEAEKTKDGGAVLADVGGIKVAFISFTKGVNNLSLPAGSEYAVNLLYTDYATDYTKVDEDAIVSAVKAAKALGPDAIVALLHWGAEYETAVSDSQTKIKNLLFQNGVDVIIGSHPHIVGPMLEEGVTTADGEKKTCFTAYSLGNFFSGKEQAHTAESCVLNVEFTKDGETGETTISNVSYVPVYLADSGKDAKPEFEVLPIRSAIDSGLFPDLQTTMTDAIANLRTATASDYDSGK